MTTSRSRRLARFLLPALAALLFAATAAAAAPPLLTPQQLSARLGAEPPLHVLDIRAGKDGSGRTPYEVGHVEGSLPAPYPQWRGPQDNPGALPPHDRLAALLQSLGIDAATPVVIVYEGVDSTDFGSAARVYWTLKAAGVRELSILNGGMRAWRAAQLPVSRGSAPQVARSNYAFTLDPRLLATREEVAQAQTTKRELLLDARPLAFFLGETRHPAARTPGTLVGAKDVDNAVWFAPQSAALLDAASVQNIARQQGIDTTQPTISFCNTGHWAATNWFVLSEVLGNPNVKLYPESMVGWSRAGGAMANVPGRLRQLWLQLRAATGTL
jgi:thiosulfate/3-mercaptopyruvate sulfurtransferase